MSTEDNTAKSSVSKKEAAARSRSKAAKKSSTAVVRAKPAPSPVAEFSKLLAVAEYSPAGLLLTATDAVLALTGHALEELKGQPHRVRLDANDASAETYIAAWAKLSKGESANLRYRMTAKDGREVWVQSSFSALLDRAGNAVRIIEVSTDVSAEVRETYELRRELEVRNQILDITSIVSYADKKGDITGFNQKYLEITKFSPEELMGAPHSITRHPDMPKEVFKKVWNTIGHGQVFRGVIKNRAKDGTPYFVDAVIAPIMGKNGKPEKYIGVRYDITEAELARQNMQGVVDALNKSQASIEFTMDGKIMTANENFLGAVGYSLDEIRGQHHSMFVDTAYRSSVDYRQFWEKLGRGEYQSGQYKRVGKGGKEIWIQASYNPINDEMGRPVKVIKYCTDITAQKLQAADYEGQLAAISKAQAVIEFDLKGTILNANENFCNALGYSLAEIKGQHHSMFADAAYRASPEYAAFWQKLGRGEFDAGQYKRIAKGGREIWIQASYNPIMDMDGRPFKVVKYATDVTAQVKAAEVLKQAVEQTQVVVGAAKEGDLTQRVPLEGKTGSIADLCGGVNDLIENMADIVGRIKHATEAINVAAKEIASGNSDLSARTEQQAASLEETASSMEELTSTVKQNAENAKQANQLAIGASDVAVKGGQVVGGVVTTMSQISDSSKKISDIIGVIDGIAFQTNILALNAAVEAARAGEQGRGFAVVAAEVRSLAQRSAGAAKEIKTLIGDSVEKVSNGTKLVEQAGKTMEEIVSSVKRVTDIMGEITAASQEQSSGIEQINQTVTQMDEVTQQNAALVEEATAAARSLEEQAIGLSNAVAVFQVDDSAAPAAVAKVTPPGPARASAPKAVARPVPKAATAQRPTVLHKPKAVNGGGRSDDQQWAEF